jgi:hypothetical protein
MVDSSPIRRDWEGEKQGQLKTVSSVILSRWFARGACLGISSWQLKTVWANVLGIQSPRSGWIEPNNVLPEHASSASLVMSSSCAKSRALSCGTLTQIGQQLIIP